MTVGTLRVCHVITRLDVGGAQETVVRLCAGLNRQGFETSIICGPDPGTGGSLLQEARNAGVPVRVEPSLVWPIRPHQDAAAIRHLVRHFRETAPDVVHTHSSKAGVIGRLAARAARVPVVVHTVHGWSFRPEQGWPTHGLYRSIERPLARITDTIVVVASTDRATGLAAGIGTPAKYELIRSGIDVGSFAMDPDERALTQVELGLDPDAPVMGWIGRFDPVKQPQLLLDVLQRGRREVPDLQLLAVGDGPLRSAFEERARVLGLGGSVVTTGVRRDIPALLSCLDVLVLVSSSEGMPRSVAEAQAAGVPVVSFDVGGVGDAVVSGRSGLLAPPGDVGAMATAVARVVTDEALSAELAAAARRSVVEFDDATMLARTACLYRRLVRDQR